MKLVFCLPCLLLGWGAGGAALAPVESGDVAVVIYNSELPESKAVAEHYARQRRVPSGQVLGLALPVGEVMTRAQFRTQLQEPLFDWLVERRLFSLSQTQADSGSSPAPAKVVHSRIRYAVLCYGVPLKIQRDDTLIEAGASQLRAELRRNEAAVDSELVWLPRLREEVMLAGLMTNVFYGTTNASLLHPTNGVLLVGRLDGPSADIARGLVDKALEAERDGLWGRAYVDARGIKEGNLKIGDDLMHGAAQFCSAEFGFSWQTTVVGDPLYRPWHLTLAARQRDLEQRRSPLAAWAHAMRADQQLSRGAPLGEIVEQLQQVPLTPQSPVLAEKLGDLLRLQGNLIIAMKSYEKALTLHPSGQQKVRLFLALAGLQAASGLDRSAIRTLQQFLVACPDYGNLLDVQERLHGLAVKVGDKELAEKCAGEIQRLKGAAPLQGNPSKE